MNGHRCSIRLPDVDYGRCGLYFFTLCTINRDALFGSIDGEHVQHSPAGKIVCEEWLRTPIIRPGITLDEWIVMPDHFHAIVDIDEDKHRDTRCVGAHRCAPCHSVDDRSKVMKRQPRSLSTLIAQFKATTTRRINEIRGTPSQKVWQRGYYERIIRNEVELDKLRQYIRDNPANWNTDPENAQQ
jgi:putative transposase